MIICLTGYSCTGKTTVSRLLADAHGFTMICTRDISHALANELGYSRTREWLSEVSIEEYLRICRDRLLHMIEKSEQDYIIDDLFDSKLLDELNSRFDCMVIELKSNNRDSRMAMRTGLESDEAKKELELFDGYKASFGIDGVISSSAFTIDTDGRMPEEIAESLYMSVGQALFVESIKKWRCQIDSALNGKYVHSLFSDFSGLQFMDMYRDMFIDFSENGKRIRAYLVILGYELCGNKADADILTASLSYEIFQSGVLIHDDIIDKSTTRRNKPTIHVKLGDNHTALSKAICLGDLGIINAVEILTCTKFPSELISKAISHQLKVFKLTIAGELSDIELSEKSEYTSDDVINMYTLKTSWYTMIGPLQLGAILGGADSKLLEKIEELGTSLGVAFQIIDDILGIFEKREQIGKSNLTDMREGKKTIITEHFLSNADTAAQERFVSIYGNSNSGDVELEEVQELLKKSGSYNYSLTICNQYLNNAREILDSLGFSNYQYLLLLGFIEYLSKRDY